MAQSDPYAALPEAADPYANLPEHDAPAAAPHEPGLGDKINAFKDRILAPFAPMTDTQRADASKYADPVSIELNDAVLGGAHAVGSMVLHPYDTVNSTLKTASDLLNWRQDPKAKERLKQQGRELVQGFKDHPAYTVGGIVAPLALGEAAGEVSPVEGVEETPKIPTRSSLLKKGAQRLTGTGPELAKEAVSKAAKGHADELADVTESNRQLEGQRARRRQVEQDVQKQTEALKAKTEQIKNAAKAKNDENWSAYRKKVGTDIIDPAGVHSQISELSSKMLPAEASEFQSAVNSAMTPEESAESAAEGEAYDRMSPEWKAHTDRMTGALEHVEGAPTDGSTPLTPSVLRNTIVELGHKIYRGGYTSGNVRYGLKTLRDSLKGMEKTMAEERGAGRELEAANQSHSDFQDAFGKPRSKTLSAADQQLKASNPQAYAEQVAKDRVGKISKHDPTYADDVSRLGQAHETLRSFPKEEAISNAVKATPDEPIVDIKQIKEAQLDSMAKQWRSFNGRDVGILASSVLARPIFAMIHGGSEALEIGAGAYLVGKQVAASLAQNPAVIRFLTKPTLEEVQMLSKIPGADRVKVVNGFTDAAVQAAKTGKPLKIAPQTATWLGPANMRRILAASAADSQPMSRKDVLDAKP